MLVYLILIHTELPKLEFIPFWIGMGITFYGMAYFFVHDLFIHQRVKVLKKTKNKSRNLLILIRLLINRYYDFIGDICISF